MCQKEAFEKFNILELDVELSGAAKGLEVKLENAQKSNKKESNLPAWFISTQIYVWSEIGVRTEIQQKRPKFAGLIYFYTHILCL